MANFEVPENPEFTQKLRKLESTDLAHADTFNPLFQTLLNNTVSLFKKIGSMAKVATSGSYIDLLDKPDIPTVPSSIKNPYKWKANGKVYDGSSEQDMGTLEVAYGGTGATTAEDARENLGLGSAATQKVANNDTTTAEGYLADARIVRQHGIEIDQINSDLTEQYVKFPNLTNPVAKSGNWTADSSGWLYYYSVSAGDFNVIKVNDVKVHVSKIGGTQSFPVEFAGIIPIRKDDKITVSVGTYGSLKQTFFPD